jgi:hypothetical protein
MHHIASPYPGQNAAVASQLAADGYTISHTNSADENDPGTWVDSEMIYIDPRTHTLYGADDQRHSFGKAAGYQLRTNFIALR